MIGLPINALLDWPMAPVFGYRVISNALLNQQIKKILGYWSNGLATGFPPCLPMQAVRTGMYVAGPLDPAPRARARDRSSRWR